MDSKYDPSAHIQRLAVGPRDETVLEQREITVQSYQSTVPFNAEKLESGLEAAWLSPRIRFGVFSRLPVATSNSATVVLGLQDELSIRAYDYDERRPIWFSWQNAIVDTVSVHYFSDEHGLLHFTTTGGGRRITDELLHEFNATHLGVPKGAVSKRHFDLDKLRSLCFDRFVNQLYMVRFTGPSGTEYQSIDHALFQSRKYIDPNAERLKEIRGDTAVTIESFDSDVQIVDPMLVDQLNVRFFLSGLSGSLRLRFPKIRFKQEPKTPGDHARAFYQLVDTVVGAILDIDYYTHQPRRLDELDVDLGIFPDSVDLTSFRNVLANPDVRNEFLNSADFRDFWPAWKPHLRALDELAEAEGVASHCADVVREIAISRPQQARALLDACRHDARVARLAEIVASACWEVLHSIPAQHRADVESEVLGWALATSTEKWRVDTMESIVHTGLVALSFNNLSLERIADILGRLLNALHMQLLEADGDLASLLDQMRWCIEAISAYSPSQTGLPSALRLVASDAVPTSPTQSARVLREPAESFEQLDEALLAQFGLPPWPHLSAYRDDGEVVIENNGIGAALALTIAPAGRLFASDGLNARDLPPGAMLSLPLPPDCREVSIQFRKFGVERCMLIPVGGTCVSSRETPTTPSPAEPICRKRLERQREYREQIDPNGVVIGASPALLTVFEEIAIANSLHELAPILILGETGVGKTHIARLIHQSGQRHSGPFLPVNAGGAGGDLNIQRSEWIGCSPGHGITGVDPKGKQGHLVCADGGTLFIDEFDSISTELQANFLSVLDGNAIQMVGGKSVTPSVRCIFATNADIDAAVSAGSLRRDLLNRMAVTITVPPLRERRGDILLLARHLTSGKSIHERCMIALLSHEWPGNIRELKTTLERAVAKAQVDDSSQVLIEHCDLPDVVVERAKEVSDEDCRRELWHCADALARAEGYEFGAGLQRRTGEIMGVKEPQASRMYKEFGLGSEAVA